MIWVDEVDVVVADVEDMVVDAVVEDMEVAAKEVMEAAMVAREVMEAVMVEDTEARVDMAAAMVVVMAARVDMEARVEGMEADMARTPTAAAKAMDSLLGSVLTTRALEGAPQGPAMDRVVELDLHRTVAVQAMEVLPTVDTARVVVTTQEADINRNVRLVEEEIRDRFRSTLLR